MKDGGREYALRLSSSGDILLTRINTRYGEGGALSTSLQELLAERNRQIMGQTTVMIEGCAYYVLGQGDGAGSFLFFRKDDIDENPNGNAHPELMGYVAQVLSDGSTARISGHPRLGTLRNGDPFHLEFGDDGVWRVVAGEGDTGN
jgi:hypothetical protein